MNYALLLAGGSGTRMGNTGVPKQFLTLKDKPVIIYSIENMLKCKEIDRVIVVCNPAYTSYLHNLLVEYELANSVEITEGGKNRLESAVNGVMYIEKHHGINDEDVFLAHDSVRIFTSERIISENIKYAREYGAATTVYVLEETILEANEDGLLYRAYPRENRYTGQSPQTFNVRIFMDCVEKLNEKQRDSFTDLAEALYVNNKKVYPVMGEKDNIKLTTPFDMVLANMRLEEKDS